MSIYPIDNLFFKVINRLITCFLWILSFLIKNLMNWQQGYAPPNSDRREGVLKRKRLEYLDCVSQYYDIPDTERSDDEINMLRQVFSNYNIFLTG